MVHHSWQGHSFWISPQRFIYWEKEKTIILSDLHLGKTGHFRKEGIAMPQQVYKEDLQRLFTTLQQFKPDRLLIVGDMVHSRHNKELDWFSRWRNDFSQVDFTLIKGNHDILKDEWYEEHKIKVFHELQVDNLLFLHDNKNIDLNWQLAESGVQKETQKQKADGYGQVPLVESIPIVTLPTATISGHVHPGIRVNGIGRQSMELPCFCFSNDYLLLPAYSKFTGLFTIKPTKEDAVFLIVGDKVIRV